MPIKYSSVSFSLHSFSLWDKTLLPELTWSTQAIVLEWNKQDIWDTLARHRRMWHTTCEREHVYIQSVIRPQIYLILSYLSSLGVMLITLFKTQKPKNLGYTRLLSLVSKAFRLGLINSVRRSCQVYIYMKDLWYSQGCCFKKARSFEQSCNTVCIHKQLIPGRGCLLRAVNYRVCSRPVRVVYRHTVCLALHHWRATLFSSFGLPSRHALAGPMRAVWARASPHQTLTGLFWGCEG